MAVDIDTAELAGVIAEGVLYGIFLTLFIVATYVFAGRKSRKKATLNLPMAITGIVMILLATAQLALDTANIFVAFLNNDRVGRLAYLFDVTTGIFSAKHCVTITQLVVGDSFVTYRCWVVWGKNKYIVILPILLSLGSAVSGSYVMWVFAHVPGVTVKQQTSMVATIWSLSLLANAVATMLLAFKIWSVDRAARRAMGSRGWSLMPVAKMFLETGALNAAYLFVWSVAVINGTQMLEFMAEIASPLSGIIFAIVIIRVGLNAGGEAEGTLDRPPRSSIKFASHASTNTTALSTRDHELNLDIADDASRSAFEVGETTNECEKKPHSL